MADAYYSIGIYEKAIYNYENAVRLNNHLDEAYYNMGVCLYLQENYKSAQLHVHKALVLSPDNQNYIELESELKKKISFWFDNFYGYIMYRDELVEENQ